MRSATAWRIIVILSVVSAGASIGNETARYFWDLTAYVEALDTLFPYRFDRPYPFLYPPVAADLFRMARSHLFELISIGYVAAGAFFLWSYAQLNMRRSTEWLLAITAMGGLGVVSLLSGNVAVPMNLTLLALALQAATGSPLALPSVPVAIGLGALIKPQFALYLGLLWCLERSRTAAIVKSLGVGVAVAGVHGLYVLFRPADWNEYVQAVAARTMEEKDFGWGPAALMMRFSETTGAALAAYVAGFLIVGVLAYTAWRKSARAGQPMSRISLVSLAFVVLTFANPRIPLYDLYAAAIALIVCCGQSGREPVLSRVMVLALAINLVPWTIANFSRVPSAYPWWMRDLLITHLLGIGGLLIALVISSFLPPSFSRPSSLVPSSSSPA